MPKDQAGIGHNSAGARIKSFVERVERLNEEKDGLTQDINDVLKEAENVGFDKKIIKVIVKIRKDKAQFQEDMALVDSYMAAMNDQLNFDFGAPYGEDRSAMDELMEDAA